MADLQPTLTGETVLLRPLRAEDRSAFRTAASDPLIWALHPMPDRYREPGLSAYFDHNLASGGALAIVERSGGAIIGGTRYSRQGRADDEVEIGWTFLVRRHWGGATNAEVKRLLIDHAFGFADVAVFAVGEHNWRSQAAMRKIGGVQRAGKCHHPLDPARATLYVEFEIRKPHSRSRCQ